MALFKELAYHFVIAFFLEFFLFNFNYQLSESFSFRELIKMLFIIAKILLSLIKPLR